MGKNEIKAMAMIRRIREAHYEQLKDKTSQERIAFYRKKAQRMNAKIKTMLPGNRKEDALIGQGQNGG
jgi:hypothetical protein